MKVEERVKYLCGILLVIFIVLPFVLLGEESYVLIHDNLDSEFIYLQVLKISNNLLGFDGSIPIKNIFNGLPRKYIHSEYSFIRILFYIFPSFWAYVINSFIVRVIGFMSIYLLAKDYFHSNKSTLTLIVALSFAALPIYSIYGLSVMGQPLVLWAFLNLKNKIRMPVSFAIITLFPFYAHFAMTAPFILTALSSYAIYLSLNHKKQVGKYYIIGIGILLFSYMLANYHIIYAFVSGSELSNRKDWIKLAPGFADTIHLIWQTILTNQYHSAALNSLPIIALLCYSILKKAPKAKSAFLIFISIVIIAIFNGIYPVLSHQLKESISILTSFQFNRFTFLIPFFYFIIVLLLIQNNILKKPVLYLAVLLQLVLILYSNKEFLYNYKKIIPFYNDTNTSFESFFSAQLFKEIEDYIDLPKENFRVVSIGIHPSIAQYNGFYTLDSYQNNYPLAYKKQFRNIIEGELNKSEKLKKYFDNWGNRCYIFSAELENSCYLSCQKNDSLKIKNLLINTNKLKQLGARYILSAVPILNFEEINIKFERSFKDDISNWNIHLYKL